MIAYVRGEGERDYKTILQELASAEVRAVPGLPDPRTRARPSEGVHGHRVPRRNGVGHRHRPLEEGGGAAGRARGLRPSVGAGRARGGAPGARGAPKRARTRPPEAAAPQSAEGRLVELPEVEVMRRDLEKDVVGRKVAEAEVRPSKNAMRVIRRHAKRKEFARPGRRAQVHQGRAPRQVRPAAHGQRRRARDALRHERPVRPREQAGAAPAAYPRRPHVPAGRRPAVRRPADVRRDVRRHRGRARQGQGAPAPRDRPARPRVHVAGVRSRARAARRQDEAAADGSEVRQRAREHLLGRGAVRRRSALRPPLGHAVLPGGATALPRDAGGPAGGDPVPGHDARGRGVPGPVRQAGRVPERTQGVRAGRAPRAVAAEPRSRPSRSRAGTRTSARSASRSRRRD